MISPPPTLTLALAPELCRVQRWRRHLGADSGCAWPADVPQPEPAPVGGSLGHQQLCTWVGVGGGGGVGVGVGGGCRVEAGARFTLPTSSGGWASEVTCPSNPSAQHPVSCSWRCSAGGLTGGGGGGGPSHLIPLQQAAPGGASFDPGTVCALLPLHSGGAGGAGLATSGQHQFAPDSAAAVFAPVRASSGWVYRAPARSAPALGSPLGQSLAALPLLAQCLASVLHGICPTGGGSMSCCPAAGGWPLCHAGVHTRGACVPADAGGPPAGVWGVGVGGYGGGGGGG